MKKPDRQTESITTMEGAGYSSKMCFKLYDYLQRDNPIGPYGANWREMEAILEVPGSCPYKEECSVYERTIKNNPATQQKLNFS